MMCHRGTAFAKYCGIRFLFFITSATSNEGKKDNIEFLNVKRVTFYKTISDYWHYCMEGRNEFYIHMQV